ncbi:MAG TPA: hypothetical protein VFS66_06050 [Acidimicrobiia bacterium]|nr:hypothetical protein [Acidimicrobiia bacterium]
METISPGRQIGGSEDVSVVYEKYGKPDLLASVLGMFTGLGVLAFVSALIAAGAGSIEYQLNVINADGVLDEASIVGLAVAALIVFASFLAGGFAAGRMSRYGGGVNGLGAGLWLILLVAIFAALGAWVGTEYNAFSQVDLPNWFAQVDVDDVTGMAIAASAVLVIATLLGGYLGGRLGETYHTKVDAALIDATRKEV